MKQKLYIYIFFVIIVVSTLSFNACKKEVYNKVSIASDSSITIFNATPGSLENTLTASEKASTSKLTISGTIDARDFNTMHTTMPKLSVIDISNVKIIAYNGIIYSYQQKHFIEDRIPDIAFDYNTNIQSIILPNNLKSIGTYSFEGCKGLKSLLIPSSDTIIENGAFCNCNNLNSVTIPNSVINIYSSAFSGCINLSSINIPSSVTFLGQNVFEGCSQLTNVNLSPSLTNIISGTFSGCTSLKTITIPSNVTYIQGSAFTGCSSLSSISLSYGLISLGGGAAGTSVFGGDSLLTSISIPASVTKIDGNTFLGCPNLRSLYIHSIIPFILEDHNPYFNGITTSCTLYVPKGTKQPIKQLLVGMLLLLL